MSQVVLGVLKLGAMSTVPQVIVWTLPSEEFDLTKMSRGDHDILTVTVAPKIIRTLANSAIT